MRCIYTYSLFNSLIFYVGHLCVRLGKLGTCIREYYGLIWVGKESHCLVHDVWLTAIAEGCPKVLLQLPYRPVKIVQGSFPKVKYVNFQVTAQTLKLFLASGSEPWVLVRVFLPLYLLDLGAYPLFLTCEFLYSFLSGVQGGLVSDIHWTFPHSFLLLCWIHEFCAVIFTGLVNGNTYELSS